MVAEVDFLEMNRIDKTAMLRIGKGAVLDRMQTDIPGSAGILPALKMHFLNRTGKLSCQLKNYPHLLSPQFKQVIHPSISTSALV